MALGSSLGETEHIAYIDGGKDADIYQYMSMELSIADHSQSAAHFHHHICVQNIKIYKKSVGNNLIFGA